MQIKEFLFLPFLQITFRLLHFFAVFVRESSCFTNSVKCPFKKVEVVFCLRNQSKIRQSGVHYVTKLQSQLNENIIIFSKRHLWPSPQYFTLTIFFVKVQFYFQCRLLNNITGNITRCVVWSVNQFVTKDETFLPLHNTLYGNMQVSYICLKRVSYLYHMLLVPQGNSSRWT